MERVVQMLPMGEQPSKVFLAWNTVARYDDYASAQAAVDYLADNGFPVEHITIVGSDLQLVEQVTGRLTKGKAALSGAASGAWFGLLIGLLFGVFTTGNAWFAMLLTGLVLGAAWGALFGFGAHAATGGRRDFSSRQTLAAAHYDVVAGRGDVDQARSMLAQGNLLPATTEP